MKIFTVCAPSKSVSTSAFLPSHPKRSKNARAEGCYGAFLLANAPDYELVIPALKQLDYKTITAADTTVVHTPPSPTTSDVAMLKVSLGFESVHVSYMLEASFSA
jgi:hypothetical protein